VTPAVLDRPASLFAERLGGGRVTLEERLNAALHEVRANGSTECPVCQARMTFAAASAGSGAACSGCGSKLS
jgi:transcription initiation factor IIE alpha subunit